MIETLKPRSADEVVEAVQWAVNSNSPVELIGAGTKRGLGHPVRKPRGERLLDLSALSGVTSYQPEELVVTVLPGTPVSELHALLDKMEQQLGFEPPDFGPLYGNPENCGTIGGLIGCNHSGPRRFRSGAARDHVLGQRLAQPVA